MLLSKEMVGSGNEVSFSLGDPVAQRVGFARSFESQTAIARFDEGKLAQCHRKLRIEFKAGLQQYASIVELALELEFHCLRETLERRQRSGCHIHQRFAVCLDFSRALT